MSYTVYTPIVGKPTGTLAEALGWLDIKAGAETDYATELWRLCTELGIDPAVIFAQAAHETGDFSSPRWQFNRNPAGLGIESDSDSDPAKLTGKEAAQLHAWCVMWALEQPTSALFSLPESAQSFIDRWFAKFEDHRAPKLVTIGDLGQRYVDATGEPQAVWGWDAKYSEKIAAKANAIFPNRQEVQPMSTPVIYNLATDYARFGLSNDEAREVLSHRFDNRNGVKPQFIVLHIQAGTSQSSLDWWANAVQASSTVMIQHDGSVLNIIPEAHGPWTNGDDAQPTANGARLVNLPGNSNLYTLSIEAEGKDGSDTTSAQLDSIVWQVEKWMAQYDIPKENVLRHGDINSVTRPNCPGAYYPKVMARISETPTGPQYATPLPITWKAGDLGWKKLGDASVYCLEAEVEAVRATTPLAWADGDKSDGEKAPNAGPKIKQGERVKVIGSFANLNEKGQTVRWLVRASDNARIIGSSCRPLLPIKQ